MHLWNRLFAIESFHCGLDKDQGQYLLNRPSLCKLPRHSAKNSYEAFGVGGTSLALDTTVNWVNSISGAFRSPLSAHFFLPRSFTILFMAGGHPMPTQHQPYHDSDHWEWVQAKDFFSNYRMKGARWSLPPTQHYITEGDAKSFHVEASLRAKNFTSYPCRMR